MLSINLILFFSFCCTAFQIEILENANACAEDLRFICGMNQPTSYVEDFNARYCLKFNSDEVSNECKNYLAISAPSLVETCFHEIKTLCNNVNPGSGRIHACLYGFYDKISVRCASSLMNEKTSIDSNSIMKQTVQNNDQSSKTSIEKKNHPLTSVVNYFYTLGSSKIFTFDFAKNGNTEGLHEAVSITIEEDTDDYDDYGYYNDDDGYYYDDDGDDTNYNYGDDAVPDNSTENQVQDDSYYYDTTDENSVKLLDTNEDELENILDNSQAENTLSNSLDDLLSQFMKKYFGQK